MTWSEKGTLKGIFADVEKKDVDDLYSIIDESDIENDNLYKSGSQSDKGWNFSFLQII